MKAALVNLALFVLQHPDTLAETEVLARKLVKSIVDDADTVQQVWITLGGIFGVPSVRYGSRGRNVDAAKECEYGVRVHTWFALDEL